MAVGAIETGMLVLPVAGMTVTLVNVLKRMAAGFRKLWETRPAWGLAAGAGSAAAVVFAAFVLWPNGEYRPIQPQERWTFDESLQAVKQVNTGRPSLTEEIAEELEGAPTVAEDVPGLSGTVESVAGTEDPDADPDGTPLDESAEDAVPAGDAEPTPTPRGTPEPSDDESPVPPVES